MDLKSTLLFLAAFITPLSCSNNNPPQHPRHTAMSLDVEESPLGLSVKRYYERLLRAGFNGSVLIAHNGKIILKEAHGLASRYPKKKLTPQSVFQLASATKPFTAVAVMKLKEMGLLSYDDPVTLHIPEFPWEGITIRQLLAHRSGLMNYMYFCDNVTDRKEPMTNTRVISLLARHKPDNWLQPGQRFDYNNTNYMLLASIVERASGQSFPDFLEKHIFSPLHMDDSFVHHKGDTAQHDHLTKGYYYKWRMVYPLYLETVYGDKGVYTSVEDLYRFDRALYTNRIISQKTLQESIRPANDNWHGNRNYGYGWRLRTLANGQQIHYHTGWWRGYNALFVRIPSTQSTIIILANELNRSFFNFYPQLALLLSKTHGEPA